MPFTIPPFIRRPRPGGNAPPERHTFRRLRSFYLSPPAAKQEFQHESSNTTTSSSSYSSPATSPTGGPSATHSPSKGGAANLKTSSSIAAPAARGASAITRTRTRTTTAATRPRNSQTRRRLIGGSTTMFLVALLSLLLVMCLSLSFLGADVGSDTYFKRTLDQVAFEDPGLVLVGESVDVDIDEPSVEIRWSIVACGGAEGSLVLPGSYGILGSAVCGLPAEALHIFVDSQDVPVATYNPSQIPYSRDGIRRPIQSLTRFSTTHTLDVHKARLYPFDKYTLSTSLRAALATNTNETRRVSRVVTAGVAVSFDVESVDLESFVGGSGGAVVGSVEASPSPSSTVMTIASSSISETPGSSTPAPTSTISSPAPGRVLNNAPPPPPPSLSTTIATTTSSSDLPLPLLAHIPSRDIDIYISRPPSAQLFVIALFTLSWMMAYMSVGVVLVGLKRSAGGGGSGSNNSGESRDGKDGDGDGRHEVYDGERRSSGQSRTRVELWVHLLVCGAILVGIRQLRKSMPDAPGFDGVLLDCIGFFPQMIIVGACLVVLLFTLAAREIDAINHPHEPPSSSCSCSSSNTAHCEHGHERHHHHRSLSTAARTQHCCRASIISSFPQPPVDLTSVPEPQCWHFLPPPPPLSTPPLPPLPLPRSPATPHSATGQSITSPSTSSLLLTSGARKQPPQPLSLNPRSSFAGRFEFDVDGGAADGMVDVELGLRRTVSSSASGRCNHRRASTMREEREVSRWSDHEDD